MKINSASGAAHSGAQNTPQRPAVEGQPVGSGARRIQMPPANRQAASPAHKVRVLTPEERSRRLAAAHSAQQPPYAAQSAMPPVQNNAITPQPARQPAAAPQRPAAAPAPQAPRRAGTQPSGAVPQRRSAPSAHDAPQAHRPRQRAAQPRSTSPKSRTGHAQRRARKSTALLPFLFLAFSILLLAVVLWRFAPWNVRDLTLEVGSPLPSAQDFSSGGFEATLVRGLDSGIDMNTVGDHEVVFKVLGFEQTAILHVVDSVAPVVVGRDIEAYVNGTVQPEDLIESMQDKTPLTVAFVSEPKLSVLGLQQVRVRVTDAGGNHTDITANINVLPDNEPPVISGVQELTVEQGGTVAYKRDIVVTDNCDTDLQLQVDNSAVNLNVPGSYPVIYTVTDSAGNTATASTVLHVITPLPPDISEDVVQAAANDTLAALFPNGLDAYSQRDIIYAIYRYCHDNIGYVDSSNKDNWIEACYRGLVEHRGDCYVYAMSAKLLLTYAGIQNRDIAKIPHGDSLHFWNLVNIGEGWYHFDTTRRVDGSEFFYLTDVELMRYSNAHNYSHAYDPYIYTDIVGQSEAEHRYPPGVAPSGPTELPAA